MVRWLFFIYLKPISILLLSGCTSKVWFKTYYNEVQWYEFRDKGGLPVLRTQNELALEDTLDSLKTGYLKVNCD